MKKLKILITGAGAPGIKGTIFSLRDNYDRREIEIIGTDINPGAVGKYLCDKFLLIPKAKDNNYLSELLKICQINKVDILIPQNTSELLILAKNKTLFEDINTKVIISDENAITISNDKYELMKLCKKINVPVGDFFLVNNSDLLIEKAKELGWPEKKVVVKPPVSNGLRGVRIIDEKIDLKKMFFDEKPTSLFIKMNNLIEILGESFPDIIVTEYLPGDEFTVDVLAYNNNVISFPKRRKLIRSGITFNATVEKHEEIISYSNAIAKNINMKYCFGFQFKLDEMGIPKILESNPRVQGTMVLSTFANANVIYSSVKHALGEEIPQFDIKWGTKILRYWGGVGINGEEIIYL